MRKHVVFAALAIVSALALPSQVQAKADQGGIITCDRQGCRATGGADAARAVRSPARKAHRTGRHRSGSRIAHHGPSLPDLAAGVVRSKKTGFMTRVGSGEAGRFQAYIDEIEATGATVRFMGGIRRGRCSEASKHPCGKALDVCQLYRGVVDARCHLPAPAELERIAARYGLVEGGRWCSSDYGHAELAPGARTCPGRRYAVGKAIIPTVHRLARRHHVKVAAAR